MEYLNVFTTNNTAKRIKLTDLKTISRAKKGMMLIKKNKTVNYGIMTAFTTMGRDTIIIKKDSEIKEIKNSDISIMDVSSNGGNITRGYVDSYSLKYSLKKVSNLPKESINEEKKEDKQVSFADFTKDFKI